jgi:hypothetical protein
MTLLYQLAVRSAANRAALVRRQQSAKTVQTVVSKSTNK